MKFDVKSFAFTTGIFWGLAVFIATIWVIIGPTQGVTLAKLQVYYLGYSVSLGGEIIGLIWGLVHGFISGLVFSSIYNIFAKSKQAS